MAAEGLHLAGDHGADRPVGRFVAGVVDDAHLVGALWRTASGPEDVLRGATALLVVPVELATGRGVH